MTEADLEERFRRLEEVLAAIDAVLSVLESHICKPASGNWSWKTPDEH